MDNPFCRNNLSARGNFEFSRLYIRQAAGNNYKLRICIVITSHRKMPAPGNIGAGFSLAELADFSLGGNRVDA